MTNEILATTSFLLAVLALCQIAERKFALKYQKISKRRRGTSVE